ncbi:hypothetical protein K2173_022035 [Erythroxylum novogranatense]|uniref:DUF1664 domain-containing protein n=1 Tax=Erythroxylum novogranatense TaxID=1862640 RepID=A0AAV8T2U2_9ROSI|nr:hypothetical protein K2173_022035 [Erythroxylum novogranatense]
MAMQSGIGLSKIVFLAGAGYTATVLANDGKLSDLIGHLQALTRRLEKSGGQSEGDPDPLSEQLKTLQNELQRYRMQPQIILNGASSQIGNCSGLIVPVATLGLLSYGYMWWKGIKFSDLMYVTKRNMATAVANLTKHLEQVSETLSAAKKHLTQRIQMLDDKMDGQKEISKAIQRDVHSASENISQIGSELWELQSLVSGLDGKIGTIGRKQDLANEGVLYLCNFVGGKNIRRSKELESLQEGLKNSGITHSSLTYPEVRTLPGLKELFTDNLPRSVSEPLTGVLPHATSNLEDQPQMLQNDIPNTLLRINSAKS